MTTHHIKKWLGIGLILLVSAVSGGCTKDANKVKQAIGMGKVSLLKVMSDSRVATERQMADMQYIDDYEVEKVMTDSTEMGHKLKQLIDNPSNYLTGEVMMQCTSRPDYYVYWDNDKDTLYGINITSGCPMLFRLKYEGPDLKILSAEHILSKRKKKFINALKEIQ
jgi:hypothetical protein